MKFFLFFKKTLFFLLISRSLINDKERLTQDCKKYEELKLKMENEIQRLESSKDALEKEILSLKEEVWLFYKMLQLFFSYIFLLE